MPTGQVIGSTNGLAEEAADRPVHMQDVFAAVYRNLIAADLTKPLDIPDNQYAALISSGTFTHGHLGPDPLNELWRVAASGAICAIGVRSTHYEDMGFVEKLSVDVANGIITKPDIKEVNVYSAETDELTHADDKYLIVQCQIVK